MIVFYIVEGLKIILRDILPWFLLLKRTRNFLDGREEGRDYDIVDYLPPKSFIKFYIRIIRFHFTNICTIYYIKV